MTLSEKLFENFSKNFDSVAKEISTRKVSFEVEKEIAQSEIDSFLESFFVSENFKIKKNKAGFLFIGEKEKALVSVTNFSDKPPFTVIMSIEIF